MKSLTDVGVKEKLVGLWTFDQILGFWRCQFLGSDLVCQIERWCQR